MRCVACCCLAARSCGTFGSVQASLFILYLPLLLLRRTGWLPRRICARDEGYQLLDQSDFFEEDELTEIGGGGRAKQGSPLRADGYDGGGRMGLMRMLKVAAVVGPCWFWANYAYNASLNMVRTGTRVWPVLSFASFPRRVIDSPLLGADLGFFGDGALDNLIGLVSHHPNPTHSVLLEGQILLPVLRLCAAMQDAAGGGANRR